MHQDKTIKGVSLKAEELFKIEYPSVYNYLLSYKPKLENRNKAETGIRYEWYALQRWGAEYWEDFSKPKIMYPNMTKYLPFIYDKYGYISNDKSFIITCDCPQYLVAVMNSKVAEYWIKGNCPELQGGTRELRKIFMENLPVPIISKDMQKCYNDIIDNIITKKELDIKADTSVLENIIDTLVYELYNLNNDEVTFIRNR